MTNEALRLFRIFNDLKLYEMADKLDISPSYLSEIEKGKKEPSLKLIEKYAKVFDIKASSIIAFSEKLDKDKKGIKNAIAKNIIKLLQEIEYASKS